MTSTAPDHSSHDHLIAGPVLRTDAHIFSVDVEEYFHAHALSAQAPRESWDRLPSRVDASTGRLLDLLARYEAHGTFFVLGWVAERHPELVRRIASAGHEVASHGYGHDRVSPMTPRQFRDDVHRSVAILEGLTGRRVLGYRAPSFSIVPGTEWAFDILLEEGLVYDSSLFPIRRPGSGYPHCNPMPHYLERPAGELLELPPMTTVIAGSRVPAAGGAYLRHLPVRLVERALRESSARNVPGMFYMHPWEIDAEQPVLPGVSWISRWRHYGGTARMLARVEQLVAAFSFTSVERSLQGPTGLRLVA